eukprot:CAMPEP_0117557092 /NCGR_PEP_ID=MMETSP0784-20121206/52149_1 /TAXON_ID=39447 /ORGANISM="" /LENGTH=208 /DNA_ID=CAMNT_0005354393 /DNA_START=128 /DNA_END=751 /DNA_ORIENTATION=+
MEFAWDAADGAQHNFSHASFLHQRGLYVAAVPFAELDGGDEDLGVQMMALTSWLDLLFKCKVKHVVCLADDEELWRRHAGLGDGDLAATCRGQGFSFHHTPLHEEWPSASALADALAAIRRTPPSQTEGVAIVGADGREVAATVAVAWLVLHCEEDAAKAVRAVEGSAKEVGASRAPLAPFTRAIDAGGDAAADGAAEQGLADLIEQA